MLLLDSVWRDLYNANIWNKAPADVRDIYRNHYARYRQLFHQAKCFNISNDALEIAINLSGDGPVKMAERLFMARLPFPKVWIEFDFIHKVLVSNKLGYALELDENTPQRLGWLLQEDPADPLRWSMTTWVSINNEKPIHMPHQGIMESSLSMITWMIDTSNRVTPERIGNIEAVDRPFLKGIARYSEATMERDDEPAWEGFRHLGWGYSVNNPGEQFTGMDPMRQLAVSTHLKNSINVGWEPMSAQIRDYAYEDKFRQQFVDSCVEARGDVRLAVALLALINEVPIIETPIQKKGSFRSAGGTLKKYLSSNTVTINIPSKHPIKQIHSIFKSKVKSHKARHQVRGHWRTIIHKKDHIRKRELPNGAIVEEFIAKEQIERVWVKNHERGDASIGYVNHEYKVEKNRDNQQHH